MGASQPIRGLLEIEALTCRKAQREQEERKMAEETKNIITEEETVAAGYPCSGSAGEDTPDVAEVEVIE